MSSPKNFFASLRARSQALAMSSARSTRRMPLPPPPEAALSITGKPIFVAAAIASSVVSHMAPGTMGTPAALIWSRAAVFEPICAHRARRRADEDDARALARLGERAGSR